jgi:predicted AlkP superfamily phosphohydrolase/phosphomutase
VVESWYLHLDDLVGQMEQQLAQSNQGKTRLIIVSDHGFARFDYKVHLNQWLLENNYLALKEGSQERSLSDVEWSESKAYALGLNSLYLNLQGREGRGRVAPDEIEPLRDKLRSDLLSWKGTDGNPVIRQVYLREEAFSQPRRAQAPDLVMGYSPGYRASGETGLGKWEPVSLEANKDHWHADHCIDPQAVPGVLFTNFGLGELSSPSFRDIPYLAIGKQLAHPDKPADLPAKKSGGEQSDEERKAMEERLKGLGYL